MFELIADMRMNFSILHEISPKVVRNTLKVWNGQNDSWASNDESAIERREIAYGGLVYSLEISDTPRFATPVGFDFVPKLFI